MCMVISLILETPFVLQCINSGSGLQEPPLSDVAAMSNLTLSAPVAGQGLHVDPDDDIKICK